MDSTVSAQLQDLQGQLVLLFALDKLLGLLPLQKQEDLNLKTTLIKYYNDPALKHAAAQYTFLASDVQELYDIADSISRFDLTATNLAYICKTSWQGRSYLNVFRHSNPTKKRDPTCSEVLSMLPRLDRLLETSLSGKMNAVIDSVRPFRFFDLPTELRLHAYQYLLPRPPCLILRDFERQPHVAAEYDFVALQLCQQAYEELIPHFYKDQVLVLNVYNGKGSWGFSRIGPRDHRIVPSINDKIRSYFKRVEIRLLDMEDPDEPRSGPSWRTMEKDTWKRDYQTYAGGRGLTEIFKKFPNLISATISWEMYGAYLKWRDYWSQPLRSMAEFLIEHIPKDIELIWDFFPTSDPDLVHTENEDFQWHMNDIMRRVRSLVTEEVGKRGGTVQLGERLVKGLKIPPRVHPVRRLEHF